MELDLENPLTSYNCDEDDDDEEGEQSMESIVALFFSESDQMIKGNDVNLSVRRDAIALIRQAQFDCNLDPFLAYLAINYVDRFISTRETSIEKPWMIRLLSIACLSLASKMKKSNFVFTDLHNGEGFIFNAQTIRRMEFLVLSALDWRMRSIAPFSFLGFFAGFFAPSHPNLVRPLKSHALQFIFKAQNEIRILDFKPSEICAAAMIASAYELFPVHFAHFRAAVVACDFVDEEKLNQCCTLMMDGCDWTMGMGSSSNTPVTVLGRQFNSFETVGSSTNDSDLNKRRV